MLERVRQVWRVRGAARWAALAFLTLACSTDTDDRGTTGRSEYEASRYPPASGGACGVAGNSATAGAADGASFSNAGAPSKEWTLAFYLAADTVNEAVGRNYINSLERRYAELEPFANIVVLWDEPDPGTKLLQIRSDDSDAFASEIAVPADTGLAHLFELTDAAEQTELLLSTPQVLRAFLDLAQARYPSKYFALTVLDHGEAWSGAVYDSTGGTMPVWTGPMPLVHFADVFSSLARPIDVLAFDACLMQEVTAHSWWYQDGRVRYVVGSEQINHGWNFDKVLAQYNGLWRAEGGLSPRSLATAIVGQTDGGPGGDNDTESVVDLAEWRGVVESLDALGAALLAAGGMTNATVKAVVNERVTRPYGDFKAHRSPTGEIDGQRLDHEDLVDAVEFCEVLERSFGADTAIARAASALHSALGKAVIANSAPRPEGTSSDSPDAAADVSHGVSLHLPKTDTPVALVGDAYKKTLGRASGLFLDWLKFVDTI